MECYTYKAVYNPSAVYNKWNQVVQCCYVLIMENSSREQQIIEQVNKLPNSVIIFQYNKGFKKCKKNNIKTPVGDTTDAHKNACKHALLNGYERILILEDDCVFDDRISNDIIIDDICTFLIETNPSLYNLGPLPYICYPFDVLSKHMKLFYHASAHAYIVNQSYMLKLIKFKNKFNLAPDFYNTYNIDCYAYKEPIAFQIWERTSYNSEYWIPFIKFKYSYDLCLWLNCWKFFNLDKCHHPGWDRAFKFFKIVSILFWIILTYTIYMMLRYFKMISIKKK